MTLTLGSLSFLVSGGKNKPAIHPRPKLPDELFTRWWQEAKAPLLAIYLLVFPMSLPCMRQGPTWWFTVPLWAMTVKGQDELCVGQSADLLLGPPKVWGLGVVTSSLEVWKPRHQ